MHVRRNSSSTCELGSLRISQQYHWLIFLLDSGHLAVNGVSGCEQHARRERPDGMTEPVQKKTYLCPHTTTVKESVTEAARLSPDQMSSQPLLPAGDPRLIAVGFGVE